MESMTKNKKIVVLSILTSVVIILVIVASILCFTNSGNKAPNSNSKNDKDNNVLSNNKDNTDNSGKNNAVAIGENDIKKPEEKKPVEMVEFVGNAEHLFFHPLIAYNELAFDGDSKTEGMDDWFVTVKEFKATLNQLHKNNFILIDIESIYELNKDTQQMARKPIMIPKGKKPIIISIDDMNYYDYMRKDGTIHKLILDNDGKVAGYSKGKDGQDVISHDNSIVPILDKFVADNPDFSLNGMKATIALTGYEGVLGYRTHRNYKNKQEEIDKVMPIIDKLKKTGWKFASHSYGHPDARAITYAKLKDDSDKWDKEVKSLIGDTTVYVYPFGSALKYKDEKFQYLMNKGFKIFCAVGPISYEELYKDVAQTDRRHCDGITLRNQRDKYLDLYDANEILDLEGRKIVK